MRITLAICFTAVLITVIICFTVIELDFQRTELLLEHLDGTQRFHSNADRNQGEHL